MRISPEGIAGSATASPGSKTASTTGTSASARIPRKLTRRDIPFQDFIDGTPQRDSRRLRSGVFDLAGNQRREASSPACEVSSKLPRVPGNLTSANPGKKSSGENTGYNDRGVTIYTIGVDYEFGPRYALGRYRIWSPTPSRIADWPHTAPPAPSFRLPVWFATPHVRLPFNRCFHQQMPSALQTATEAVYSIEDRSGDYAQP